MKMVKIGLEIPPCATPTVLPFLNTPHTQRLHSRDEEILWLRKQVEEFKELLLKNENRTVLLLEQLSL